MLDFKRPLNRHNTPLNRCPVEAVKTYSIVQPMETHFRVATCQEVNCSNFVNGFKVHVEKLMSMYGPEQGSGILHMMRTSGKKFTEMAISPGQTWVEFEAGQSCFDGDQGRHRLNLSRPPLFVVRGGDWRGNPRGEQRTHTSGADWADDMQNHRDKLLGAVERG